MFPDFYYVGWCTRQASVSSHQILLSVSGEQTTPCKNNLNHKWLLQTIHAKSFKYGGIIIELN